MGIELIVVRPQVSTKYPPWRLVIACQNVTIILVKIREVIKKLEDDDWYIVKTRGSHRQYKHLMKKGRVTVAGKPSDDLAPGTLNSIYKQAGWK